jgi:hypothetical protein
MNMLFSANLRGFVLISYKIAHVFERAALGCYTGTSWLQAVSLVVGEAYAQGQSGVGRLPLPLLGLLVVLVLALLTQGGLRLGAEERGPDGLQVPCSEKGLSIPPSITVLCYHIISEA